MSQNIVSYSNDFGVFVINDVFLYAILYIGQECIKQPNHRIGLKLIIETILMRFFSLKRQANWTWIVNKSEIVNSCSEEDLVKFDDKDVTGMLLIYFICEITYF